MLIINISIYINQHKHKYNGPSSTASSEVKENLQQKYKIITNILTNIFGGRFIDNAFACVKIER